MDTIGFFRVAVTGVLLIMTASGCALKAERLRCEYLNNPLGLDTTKPRLSWELTSGKRGDLQAAYQVLAATSAEKLTEGAADLWNSGRVESRQTNQVVYGGKPLHSGQRCYWTVRVWDREGEQSEFCTPAYWEAGLCEDGDWHGAWIGRRAASADDTAAPMLRKTFDLPSSVTRARAYVCGLGYNELYLNGQRVGDAVLDPGYTDFDKRVLYATHDVTAFLRRGSNAAGVILGRGWYDMLTQAEWNFDTAPWRSAPKLRMELVCELADGTTGTLSTDGTWKCSTGPILFDSLYEGENYDARLEKPDWATASYDDSKWEPVSIMEAPRGKLTAQQVEPIRVMQTTAPAKLTQPKPGLFVFDFGQNLTGVPQLSIDVPAGTKLDMQCGERLHPDGTLDVRAIEVFTVNRNPKNRFQTDTYIARGGGREIWQPRFTYHGFQYVQVSGYPGEMTADNLRAAVIHTPFEPTGTFRCSEPLLNQIQKNTLWSFVGNAHSIPTDCPTREKNGWTADAHLAAEQALYNFDAAAFYTKWMDDVSDAMRDDGQMPGIIPSGGWGYTKDIGPAWDSALFIIPWYLYEYYGDTRVLEAHYPTMVRYIDWMQRQAPDDIPTFGLGDWVPYDTHTTNSLTSTAYYYEDLRIIANASKLLGKSDAEATYTAMAKRVKEAWNKRFFKPETGDVDNNSQTALACGLFFGLIPAEHQAAVFQKLLSAIEARDYHIDTGILGAKYVMQVLLDHGRADVAYRLASQKTQPGWGWWLTQGATTLYEDWKGEASLNHIMFGDISAWFYKALAGLRFDSGCPGFRRAIIRPYVVGDLASAEADYHSICGRYVSSWRVAAGKLALKVSVPANTSAEVHLPAASPEQVTEGNKPLSDVCEVKILTSVAGRVVVEVGGGDYAFVCPCASSASPR